MPKILTQTEVDQFHEQGFVSPIRVMSDAEALGYRRCLERFERETGGPLGGHLRHKAQHHPPRFDGCLETQPRAGSIRFKAH